MEDLAVAAHAASGQTFQQCATELPEHLLIWAQFPRWFLDRVIEACFKVIRVMRVEVFESMLPDVDPPLYIAVLPRIQSLKQEMYEIQYGKPYLGVRKTP